MFELPTFIAYDKVYDKYKDKTHNIKGYVKSETITEFWNSDGDILIENNNYIYTVSTIDKYRFITPESSEHLGFNNNPASSGST